MDNYAILFSCWLPGNYFLNCFGVWIKHTRVYHIRFKEQSFILSHVVPSIRASPFGDTFIEPSGVSSDNRPAGECCKFLRGCQALKTACWIRTLFFQVKGNLLAYFHAASIWGILWTVISEILINNIIFVISKFLAQDNDFPAFSLVP